MFNGNLSSGDPGGNVGTFRQWLDPILTGSCLCCRWICYCLPRRYLVEDDFGEAWRADSIPPKFHPSHEVSRCHCLHHAYFINIKDHSPFHHHVTKQTSSTCVQTCQRQRQTCNVTAAGVVFTTSRFPHGCPLEEVVAGSSLEHWTSKL